MNAGILEFNTNIILILRNTIPNTTLNLTTKIRHQNQKIRNMEMAEQTIQMMMQFPWHQHVGSDSQNDPVSTPSNFARTLREMTMYLQYPLPERRPSIATTFLP